jgi:hypothetical protein
VGLREGVGEPVTREKVHTLALELATDPETVVEVVHPGFAEDAAAGGFAFAYDDGVTLVYGYDGSRGVSTELSPHDEVARFWAARRHAHRPLSLDDVPAPQRVAVRALRAGVASVAELPPAELGDVDVAVADHYLVTLRRRVAEPLETAALRVLAGDDHLSGPPGDASRAHPCDACGRAAVGTTWGRRGVCDLCYGFTTCVAHSRNVSGSNTTAMGAGFIARHHDGSECAQVSRDNRVYVRGIEGRMGEAKFGGVYVAVAPFDAD